MLVFELVGSVLPSDMIHPSTRKTLINNTVGYGIIATEAIPRGTITWVEDALDLRLSIDAYEQLPPLLRHQADTYGHNDVHRNLVVVSWDDARFINHSCEPTCLSGSHRFEIAVCDIEPGQQLTDDYANLGLKEEFMCSCGTPSCRGVLRPDDPVRMQASWDEQVSDALGLAASVRQPLAELLDFTDLVAEPIDE